MNPSTIRLIFWREIRDQLRDRRTLVTVLLLPLLIYPLLSMAFIQVAQLASAPSSRIWLVGDRELPDGPPLLDGAHLHPSLLPSHEWELTSIEAAGSEDSRLAEFIEKNRLANGQLSADAERVLRTELTQRRFDLLVIVPRGFGDSIRKQTPDSPAQILVLQNSIEPASAVAAQRFQTALQAWNAEIIRQRLAKLQVDLATFNAAQTTQTDLAGSIKGSSLQWSRVLPLILVIWALTGAFYPAVDLVAGEKERGTLETLLTSSASRLEIVAGKLLTVMSFSAATALLNMVSLLICGSFVASPLARLTGGAHLGGLPPWEIFPVLLGALLLLSALFSSLALAVAAFARSSKEGQYYLMPLIMVTMPLMLMALLPGTQLTVGTSLIPLTGLLLLIQAVMEENWRAVGVFSAPVIAATLTACWLAVRWCVFQFKDERLLFSSVERVSARRWYQRWRAARWSMPTIPVAIGCGLAIIVARFFVGFQLSPPTTWTEFWTQTLVVLIATVGAPAVVLTVACSRHVRRSLLLTAPAPWMVLQACLLAAMLHPAIMLVSKVVLFVFPLPPAVDQAESYLNQILMGAPGFWAIALVVALAPAVIEELAFRGLILSGLRSKWRSATSVLASSLLFAAAHGILQQSLVTFFVGVVLGFIAVRSGSLLPCIAYHFVHNTLSIGMAQLDVAVVEHSRWLTGLYATEAHHVTGYQPLATISALLMATILMWILFRHGPGTSATTRWPTMRLALEANSVKS